MRLRTILGLVVIIVASGVLGFGQTPPNPNTDVGLPSFGSFHGGDIDSVSLTNGNLTLHANLFCYPQRGDKLKLCFVISYNNKGYVGVPYQVCPGAVCYTMYRWSWQGHGVEVVRDGALSIQGNSQEVPVVNCPGGTCPPVAVEMVSAVSPDGASHQLGSLCSDTACAPGAGSGDAVALDASGFHFIQQPCNGFVETPGLPAVIDADGVRNALKFGAGSCSLSITTPITTNSPVRNGMPKPGWIILERGITGIGWDGSLRPTGRPKQPRYPMVTSSIHRA